ncbi:MAG: serine hydrolase [Eubacteriales bacterium]|nr:serine hydrolase [Eubacteriales bacterium]MDD4541273.1 serine hydrolase [Eubacteriales bacterium]
MTIKKHSKYLAVLLLFLVAVLLLSPVKVLAEGFEDVPGWPAIEDIRASAYSVYNATTEEFLLEHNMHTPLWNASTTKILTALTAVHHEKFDLDAKLLVSEAATYFGDPQSSRLNLKAGELITTRDVLGGLMVHSANDCAYVLAENYGGLYGYTSDLPPESWGDFAEDAAVRSREAFVNEMNWLAKNLGAKNTHFDNPCGWDGETHQTTAYDLTIMSKALLENEVLAGFASLAHYMPEPTNKHPYAGWSMLSNTNSLVVYGTNFFQSHYISRYNGVKTGTTPLAGNCLIGGGLTHDGQQLIAVILGGSVPRADDNSYVRMAVPVRTLLEYGAYLSGASSRPYQEGPLPTFPPFILSEETDPTTASPVEVTLPPEDGSTDPVSSAEAPAPENSSTTNIAKPGAQENTTGAGGITQREKLVIAFSALIVVCVIAIATGNYIYNRKVRTNPTQNDEI